MIDDKINVVSPILLIIRVNLLKRIGNVDVGRAVDGQEVPGSDLEQLQVNERIKRFTNNEEELVFNHLHRVGNRHSWVWIGLDDVLLLQLDFGAVKVQKEAFLPPVLARLSSQETLRFSRKFNLATRCSV